MAIIHWTLNMRAIFLVALISFFLCGCASPKNINGIEYEEYGFFNKDEIYDKNIQYKISKGSVVIGFGTLLVPPIGWIISGYIFGFELYEPIGVKNNE